MLDIRDLIRQMNNEEYKSFHDSLVEKKADKSIKLLELLRNSSKDDREITDELQVNSTAYYTLRSRLNDKIQEFLLQKVKGSKLEILEKVNNIDYILFNYNRTQAITIIKKLEEELIRFEKPTYLIKVYDALKRLHKSTPSYYNYSQQYNQHIAFMLEYDKMVELLGDFIDSLGKYMLSKVPEDLEHLNLVLEQINTQNNYPDSHRMFIIQAIAHLSYQLYLDEDDQSADLEPVEDVLSKAYKILDDHPEDTLYSNMKLLFDLLSFVYYHIHNIRKKEEEYYILVDEDLPRLVNSFPFYTLPTDFLLFKVQRAIHNRTTKDLYEEMQDIIPAMEINSDDSVNFIHFNLYCAACCYYSKKYEEANQYLNDLRNKVVFKSYPHAELEVKLFLALNYCLMDEQDLCNSLLKSVSRKVLTHQHYSYENAKVFKKLLLNAISTGKDKEEKLKRLIFDFKYNNTGKYSLLDYISFDDQLIGSLVKV